MRMQHGLALGLHRVRQPLLLADVELGDGRAFGDAGEDHVEAAPLRGASRTVKLPPDVPPLVSGEDAGERDVSRVGAIARDFAQDELGEGALGLLKIASAERCSARLTCSGVERGAAPPGAIGPLGKPEALKRRGSVVSAAGSRQG